MSKKSSLLIAASALMVAGCPRITFEGDIGFEHGSGHGTPEDSDSSNGSDIPNDSEWDSEWIYTDSEAFDDTADEPDHQNPVAGNCGWRDDSLDYGCGGSGYSDMVANICPDWLEEGEDCGEQEEFFWCCDGSDAWYCSPEGIIVKESCDPPGQNEVSGNCGWRDDSMDYGCGGSGYSDTVWNICPEGMAEGDLCGEQEAFFWCCDGSDAWYCSARGYIVLEACGE